MKKFIAGIVFVIIVLSPYTIVITLNIAKHILILTI